jgi:hypothetical protein
VPFNENPPDPIDNKEFLIIEALVPVSENEPDPHDNIYPIK